MLLVSMNNQHLWSKHPRLQQWLAESRLNALFNTATRVRPDDAEKIALMQRYRQTVKPAMARLTGLIATLA
jgi:DNA anti-recombination protein RmuC